jgi:Concanavalin A-like lectin/glucanases superfamily
MKLKSILLTALATLGLTAATIAQVPNYIPTNGLVGWWPFNGNANDESGNGNNGMVYGASLAVDRNGNPNSAYNFNGSGNYIGYSANNLPNASRTVSVWFYANNLNGGPGILGYGGNTCGTSFFIAINQPPIPNKIINQGHCVVDSLTTTYSTSPINAWYHLVITSDVNGTRHYLNGVLMSSNSVFIANTYTLNKDFAVGTNVGTNGIMPWTDANQTWWNGKLDDIGIWNRALTSAEITALYTGVPTDNNETANTTTNVPDAISYQAVARNSQGAPLADTNVQVQFILLADSLTGAAEYSETHTLTTNSLRLFTTAFGAGSPINGSFSGIDWSAGNKYVNVQINTGSGWVDMGTQQLLSTPYSMHSATSGTIKNPGLPVYADNAAAIAGGLVAGDMYRTSAGILMVVY